MTADELCAWAFRMGLSQKEAADLLRTPFETYRKWESGRGCSCPGLLALATEYLELDRGR